MREQILAGSFLKAGPAEQPRCVGHGALCVLCLGVIKHGQRGFIVEGQVKKSEDGQSSHPDARAACHDVFASHQLHKFAC